PRGRRRCRSGTASATSPSVYRSKRRRGRRRRGRRGPAGRVDDPSTNERALLSRRPHSAPAIDLFRSQTRALCVRPRAARILHGVTHVAALPHQMSVTQPSLRPHLAQPLRASLRVVYPEDLARSLPLDRTIVVLGRREGAGTAPLLHPTVS